VTPTVPIYQVPAAAARDDELGKSNRYATIYHLFAAIELQQQIDMEPDAIGVATTHPDDAARPTRGSSYSNDGDDSLSLAGFDDILHHNRMVEAAHQQARRDMAVQTEETIVAPEELLGAEAYVDHDGGGGGCRATPASTRRRGTMTGAPPAALLQVAVTTPPPRRAVPSASRTLRSGTT
jgi:hypothetical protein